MLKRFDGASWSDGVYALDATEIQVFDGTSWIGAGTPLTLDSYGADYVTVTANGGTVTTETEVAPQSYLLATSAFDDATQLQVQPQVHRAMEFVGNTNPGETVTVVPPDVFASTKAGFADSWVLRHGQTVVDANSPLSFVRPSTYVDGIHVDYTATDANGQLTTTFTAPATTYPVVAPTLTDRQLYTLPSISDTSDILAPDQANNEDGLTLNDVVYVSGVDIIDSFGVDGTVAWTSTATLGNSVYTASVDGLYGSDTLQLTITTRVGTPLADDTWIPIYDMDLPQGSDWGTRGYPTDIDPDFLYVQNLTDTPVEASGIYNGQSGNVRVRVSYRIETDVVGSPPDPNWYFTVAGSPITDWHAWEFGGSNGIFTIHEFDTTINNGDSIGLTLDKTAGSPAVWAATEKIMFSRILTATMTATLPSLQSASTGTVAAPVGAYGYTYSGNGDFNATLASLATTTAGNVLILASGERATTGSVAALGGDWVKIDEAHNTNDDLRSAVEVRKLATGLTPAEFSMNWPGSGAGGECMIEIAPDGGSTLAVLDFRQKVTTTTTPGKTITLPQMDSGGSSACTAFAAVFIKSWSTGFTMSATGWTLAQGADQTVSNACAPFIFYKNLPTGGTADFTATHDGTDLEMNAIGFILQHS